jgi:hypothetical protein
MTIDVHVHPLPKSGHEDVLPEVMRQCRVNGVSLGLVSMGRTLSQYPDEDEVRRSNEEARDFARRSEGRCRWLVYLNPQNSNWKDELDRCVGQGAIGVKLWTSLKQQDGTHENAAKLLRYAGDRGLSVLIHTWQVTGGPILGEITVEELATLAERCPETTLVGAHAGGNWRHSIGVLRDRAPNTHVDVSGYYPERGLVEALVRDIGAERVLFGSDVAGRTLASQLAKVVLADISEEEKEQILWKNAARVFSLNDIPPAPSAPLRSAEGLPDFRTDHFCFCGRWPFYEGPWVTPAELDDLLAQNGIETAYTGHFGGLYRQDLESANNQFLKAAGATRRVAPLATMSPLAHNWRSVIRHLKDGFAGVLLHPYLHNWRLDDTAHGGFFSALADAKLPVWINCALADDRTRHTGVASRPAAAEELVAFSEAAPPNEYVFQGLAARSIGRMLDRRQGDGRFRFEISRLTDGSYDFDDFVGKHGLSHLVMGSEFPLRHLQEVRWTAQRI